MSNETETQEQELALIAGQQLPCCWVSETLYISPTDQAGGSLLIGGDTVEGSGEIFMHEVPEDVTITYKVKNESDCYVSSNEGSVFYELLTNPEFIGIRTRPPGL